MKGWLYWGLAVAALVAAVAVPAASAKRGPRVKLSVLPLPASALGPAAKSLPLQHDSGLFRHNGATGMSVTPNRSFGLGPFGLAKLGRAGGYALDYGLGASGGDGVTEVWTSVDKYRTSVDAKKVLALWKQDDGMISRYGGGGLVITLGAKKVAPVGSRHFAFLVRYQAANIAPLFGVDEQFTEGQYQADVAVWAGSAAAATRLAPRLAKKLDARIRQAHAGRLHAKPVKLPPKQKAERWPGGPDLAPLALKPADVGGQGTPFLDNYFVGFDPFALSYFKVIIFNAPKYDAVGQEIEWLATANQASFTADFDTASFGSHSVDLGGVGDGARGAWSSQYAAIYLSSGPLLEFVHLQSGAGSIQPSDVQRIARTAASYVDAAGLGG